MDTNTFLPGKLKVAGTDSLLRLGLDAGQGDAMSREM